MPIYCLMMFWGYNGELSIYTSPLMTHKAKNSYYLALVLCRNFTKLWPMELNCLSTPVGIEGLLMSPNSGAMHFPEDYVLM